MQSLFVKGEVSNCKYHTSGHIYFTLKDPKGTVSCIMFAGNRSGLSFRLADGQQVVVGGTVDVYERDGKYQMYAKQIILDGVGLLYEKYEQLKRELEEEGMFAPEYKQPIPPYIKTLGVVTASTGAAIRDIIQIATRRNPYVQIILYPALVQGQGAVPSIIKGIRTLEAMQVDVMIVGRGGGSIEDLWAFNEREVAQAVFDCSVPIISAVGHETDTTIIDYVSDLRAPTPSAAAELAVADFRLLLRRLEDEKDALDQGMHRVIQRYRQQASSYEMQLRYLNPTYKIRQHRQYAISLEERLQERMQSVLKAKRHALQIYIERMEGLSPLQKLNSGYAYVENSQGKHITGICQMQVGEELYIRLKDGFANATVNRLGKENGDGKNGNEEK